MGLIVLIISPCPDKGESLVDKVMYFKVTMGGSKDQQTALKLDGWIAADEHLSTYNCPTSQCGENTCTPIRMSRIILVYSMTKIM